MLDVDNWEAKLERALSCLSSPDWLPSLLSGTDSTIAVLKTLSSLRKAAAPKEKQGSLLLDHEKGEIVVQAMLCFARIAQVNFGSLSKNVWARSGLPFSPLLAGLRCPKI